MSGRRLVYKFGPSAQGWRGAAAAGSLNRSHYGAVPSSSSKTVRLIGGRSKTLVVDQLLSTVVARKSSVSVSTAESDFSIEHTNILANHADSLVEDLGFQRATGHLSTAALFAQ